MNILVVLGHPSRESFNFAIAETAVQALQDQGHDVCYHDLYREQFDPALPTEEILKTGEIDPVIAGYCRELSLADGIVIVHPNWWGQPPGILKGWVDRVFRPGVAYEFLEHDGGEGVPNGLLKARTALVLNTTNTQIERELDVFGDPLETIWKNCIFGLCGVSDFYRRSFGIIVTSTPEQRQFWLNEVRDLVCRCFPGDDAAPEGETGSSS
jgi:NAD(P)H dehydrogenase (quinone)